MEKDNDKKKLLKKILIICGVLIFLLLLVISILINSMERHQETTSQTQASEQEEEAITDYVRNRGEKDRVEYYLAEYIRNIEKGNYEKAYNKLYPDFKTNYFDTLERFERYAKATYSDLMKVEYEDIQRQGTYYIITVKITNIQAIETSIEQMFIIYEKGLNDYSISFQVKH